MCRHIHNRIIFNIPDPISILNGQHQYLRVYRIVIGISINSMEGLSSSLPVDDWAMFGFHVFEFLDVFSDTIFMFQLFGSGDILWAFMCFFGLLFGFGGWLIGSDQTEYLQRLSKVWEEYVDLKSDGETASSFEKMGFKRRVFGMGEDVPIAVVRMVMYTDAYGVLAVEDLSTIEQINLYIGNGTTILVMFLATLTMVAAIMDILSDDACGDDSEWLLLYVPLLALFGTLTYHLSAQLSADRMPWIFDEDHNDEKIGIYVCLCVYGFAQIFYSIGEMEFVFAIMNRLPPDESQAEKPKSTVEIDMSPRPESSSKISLDANDHPNRAADNHDLNHAA